MKERVSIARIAPGATIGILGGGQLGRMLAVAAARLGYRCHVYSPDADAPAAAVAAETTVAAYDDEAALTRFAAAVDVVTYEFENVPSGAAEIVSRHVPVRPDADTLATCQDRIREKAFLTGIGAPVSPYRPVTGADDLSAALAAICRPAVLKSARFGYDGKGQVIIDADTDPVDAWTRIGCRASIVERWVDFRMEISVVIARAGDGTMAAYVPVQNIHEGHILKRTIAPAPIAPVLATAATDLAGRIAEGLSLNGVLAVEMFVTWDNRLIANEMAPRPHNSGHWTLDACLISQFEQCVRAICGLPLGLADRHSDAVMDNLLGDDVNRWPLLIAEPGTAVHLYGKSQARPDRKMGHVTRLTPRRDA
jgi:5-(carboxyamino)imidazole ribonucleotide synthase